MKENYKNNYQAIKNTINSNKALKIAVYVGIGVISLYLLGKAFTALSTTVRGFNDLKSALNGN